MSLCLAKLHVNFFVSGVSKHDGPWYFVPACPLPLNATELRCPNTDIENAARAWTNTAHCILIRFILDYKK